MFMGGFLCVRQLNRLHPLNHLELRIGSYAARDLYTLYVRSISCVDKFHACDVGAKRRRNAKRKRKLLKRISVS